MADVKKIPILNSESTLLKIWDLEYDGYCGEASGLSPNSPRVHRHHSLSIDLQLSSPCISNSIVSSPGTVSSSGDVSFNSSIKPVNQYEKLGLVKKVTFSSDLLGCEQSCKCDGLLRDSQEECIPAKGEIVQQVLEKPSYGYSVQETALNSTPGNYKCKITNSCYPHIEVTSPQTSSRLNSTNSLAHDVACTPFPVLHSDMVVQSGHHHHSLSSVLLVSNRDSVCPGAVVQRSLKASISQPSWKSMNEMPLEIIDEVFQFLCFSSLLACRLVCQNFNATALKYLQVYFSSITLAKTVISSQVLNILALMKPRKIVLLHSKGCFDMPDLYMCLQKISKSLKSLKFKNCSFATPLHVRIPFLYEVSFQCKFLEELDIYFPLYFTEEIIKTFFGKFQKLRSVALNGSPLKCSLAIKIILKTHGDWLEELSVPISCLSSFDTLSDESIARKFSSLKCLVITNISSTNLSLPMPGLCNILQRAPRLVRVSLVSSLKLLASEESSLLWNILKHKPQLKELDLSKYIVVNSQSLQGLGHLPDAVLVILQ